MRATGMVLLAAFALASLGGCTATKKMTADEIHETPIVVQAEFDPDRDFSQYTSWSWIPMPIGASGNEVIDDPDWRETVDLAVEKEMFARGYVRDTQNPGLLLNAIATVEKIDKNYIKEHYEGYYFPEYFAQAPGASGKTKRKWDEGTLMVFIFDAATGENVWMGTAQTEVYKWTPDAQRKNRTREAVRLLLESLPARAK
jgi:hypothetical protein